MTPGLSTVYDTVPETYMIDLCRHRHLYTDWPVSITELWPRTSRVRSPGSGQDRIITTSYVQTYLLTHGMTIVNQYLDDTEEKKGEWKEGREESILSEIYLFLRLHRTCAISFWYNERILTIRPLWITSCTDLWGVNGLKRRVVNGDKTFKGSGECLSCTVVNFTDEWEIPSRVSDHHSGQGYHFKRCLPLWRGSSSPPDLYPYVTRYSRREVQDDGKRRDQSYVRSPCVRTWSSSTQWIFSPCPKE